MLDVDLQSWVYVFAGLLVVLSFLLNAIKIWETFQIVWRKYY